jgi:hypothetical protein
MSSGIQPPESILSRLIGTDREGVYHIRKWTTWMLRSNVKLSDLRFNFKNSDQNYSSTVFGLRKDIHHEYGLHISIPLPVLVESESPENRLVEVKFDYVENGIKVITSFKAELSHPFRFNDIPAYSLNKINDIEVSFDACEQELSKRNKYTLKLNTGSKKIPEFKIQSIGTNVIRVSNPDSLKVGKEGIAINNAHLSVGKGYTEIALSVLILPGVNNSLIAIITKLSEKSKLQYFSSIDNVWRSIAKGLQDKRLKKVNKAPQESTKVESTHQIGRPHILFLSNNASWAQILGSFCVLLDFKSDNISEIVTELDDSRCDIIVADREYFMENSLKFAVATRFKRVLKNIPLFWISDVSNQDGYGGNKHLLDLHAYEILTGEINVDDLKFHFHWAMKKEINPEGESTLIFSNFDKNRYRIGKYIRDKKIRLISRLDNQDLLTELNKYSAKWIVLDGLSLKDDVFRIAVVCLNWAAKRVEGCKVFLVLDKEMPPLVKKRLFNAGLSDAFIYNRSMESICQDIIGKIQQMRTPELHVDDKVMKELEKYRVKPRLTKPSEPENEQ